MIVESPLLNHSPNLRLVYSQLTFNRKDVLPLTPYTLWRIESGVTRSFTWNEEGQVMTLGFWGKGDIVGTSLSRLTPYRVECLSAVKIVELSPESHYLQQGLLVHAWKSAELLRILHQPSIANRLLCLLQWLADEFGTPSNGGILLDLRLTHQDLADTIGSTRVSVTRLLNRLEREGKIERSERKLLLYV